MRLLLFAILLCGASGPVAAQLTLSSPNDGSAPTQQQTDEPLPSDAELEAAGARIGGIQIDTIQIFDLSNPEENNWLFRTADHLHKGTRISAIAAQLLFRRGDLYSRRLLDETARNIRLNSSFLREPVIRPIRYHNRVVDIVVITHDVWTLQPGISYGRSGGTNTTRIDISDANILGYGTARTSIAAAPIWIGSIRTSGAAIGTMARSIREIRTARCGVWAPANRSTPSKPDTTAERTSVTITASSHATVWHRPTTATTIIIVPPTFTLAMRYELPICGPSGCCSGGGSIKVASARRPTRRLWRLCRKTGVYRTRSRACNGSRTTMTPCATST
jgi:hypothetical protein